LVHTDLCEQNIWWYTVTFQYFYWNLALALCSHTNTCFNETLLSTV